MVGGVKVAMGLCKTIRESGIFFKWRRDVVKRLNVCCKSRQMKERLDVEAGP